MVPPFREALAQELAEFKCRLLQAYDRAHTLSYPSGNTCDRFAPRGDAPDEDYCIRGAHAPDCSGGKYIDAPARRGDVPGADQCAGGARAVPGSVQIRQPLIQALMETQQSIVTDPSKATTAASPGATMSVTISLATGFHDDSSLYCICQVPGKPWARFETRVVDSTLDPFWVCEFQLGGLAREDALEFIVVDRDEWASDDFWGKATLAADRIHPGGFDGRVLVTQNTHGEESSFRVVAGFPDEGTPRSLARCGSLEPEGSLSPERSMYKLRPQWVVNSSLYRVRATYLSDFVDVQRSSRRISEKKKRFASRTVGGVALGTSLGADGGSRLQSDSFMLHPHSLQRVLWDISCFLFVCYDFAIVPVEIFLPAINLDFTYSMEWITRVYWTLDIGASCVTGVWVDGAVVMNFRAVVKKYSRTWLPLDLCIVVPDWLSLMVGDVVRAASSFLAFKVVRVLRCIRLLRLMKMDRILREVQLQFNSDYIVLYMDFAQVVLGVIFVNHLIACIWFQIGRLYDYGWIQEHELDPGPVHTIYLYSLHWSLAQFHGTMEVHPVNWQERLFAIVTLIFALIAFSSVLSFMTNTCLALYAMRKQMVQHERVLREYLKDHGISPGLSRQVRTFIHRGSGDLRSKQEREEQLLSLMPPQVVMDLHNESRAHVLVGHQLFNDLNALNTRAIREICHTAVTERLVQTGCRFFELGDKCVHMYFVTQGSLGYTRRRLTRKELNSRESGAGAQVPEPDITVGPLQWLCEAALWTVWTNCGDLNAEVTSYLLALGVEQFADVVDQYVELKIEVSVYAAKVIAFLNDHACTDFFMNTEEYAARLSKNSRSARLH